MTKKKILQQDAFYIDLEGPVSDAIEELTRVLVERGPTAKLVWDLRDCYSDSDAQSLYVAVEREETDKEYQSRLNSEAATRARREEIDRKTLAELKKKYE